jgi:hypothetical protein
VTARAPRKDPRPGRAGMPWLKKGLAALLGVVGLVSGILTIVSYSREPASPPVDLPPTEDTRAFQEVITELGKLQQGRIEARRDHQRVSKDLTTLKELDSFMEAEGRFTLGGGVPRAIKGHQDLLTELSWTIDQFDAQIAQIQATPPDQRATALRQSRFFLLTARRSDLESHQDLLNETLAHLPTRIPGDPIGPLDRQTTQLAGQLLNQRLQTDEILEKVRTEIAELAPPPSP